MPQPPQPKPHQRNQPPLQLHLRHRPWPPLHRLQSQLNLTHTYNNRLQPNEFKASSSGGNAIDITYNFADSVTGYNAGHVNGVTNNLDTSRSQTFTYDQLNRITSALTTSTHATSPSHCWGETYSLDAWGNLNSIAATTNSNYTGCTEESGFSTTADGNNHLLSFSYDASGNTTNDTAYSYTYDAGNMLKTVGTYTYLYDSQGLRFQKWQNGAGVKGYWYGAGSEVLAEGDVNGNITEEYIFFGGKRIAMLPPGGNPIYYVEDLLGTSRVITTNSGVVCYDADFYPFGGERSYTNACLQNFKFEGKERDTESGNDDFDARYYSNRFGRWLSADWSAVPVPVPYANLTNPQTLNLYSMVADDPESFADLDGHYAGPGATPRSGDCWLYEVLCTMGFYPALGNSQSQQDAENQQRTPPAPAGKCGIVCRLVTWIASLFYSPLSAEQQERNAPPLTNQRGNLIWEDDPEAKRAAIGRMIFGSGTITVPVPGGQNTVGPPLVVPIPTNLLNLIKLLDTVGAAADWVWKGTGPPGSSRGNWVNPNTGEWIHRDFPGGGHGPHFDYQDPQENRWRVFPDKGTMEQK